MEPKAENPNLSEHPTEEKVPIFLHPFEWDLALKVHSEKKMQRGQLPLELVFKLVDREGLEPSTN